MAALKPEVDLPDHLVRLEGDEVEELGLGDAGLVAAPVQVGGIHAAPVVVALFLNAMLL